MYRTEYTAVAVCVVVVVVVAVEQIAVYLTKFVSLTRFSSFRFENYKKIYKEFIALAGSFLTSKLQWNDVVILEAAHIEAQKMRYDISIRRFQICQSTSEKIICCLCTKRANKMRIKLIATSQPDKLVVHVIAVLRNQK